MSSIRSLSSIPSKVSANSLAEGKIFFNSIRREAALIDSMTLFFLTSLSSDAFVVIEDKFRTALSTMSPKLKSKSLLLKLRFVLIKN